MSRSDEADPAKDSSCIETSDLLGIDNAPGVLVFRFQGPKGQTQLSIPLATVDKMLAMLVMLHSSGSGASLRSAIPKGSA